MRGYRGFTREFARTGSLRALSLQLRTGARHWLRQVLRREEAYDPEARFLANYAADGLRPHDPERSALQLRAQACLVCGLCSAACASAGGRPPLDPREAVLAAARLETDALRLGLEELAAPCGTCRACEPVCPAGIPIARVQGALARKGSADAA
jgi:heterodisulfide reductase subunit C